MILTPKFVFLSNPKTGSTTAESMLFDAAELKSLKTAFPLRFVKKVLVKLGLKSALIKRFLVQGTNEVFHKHGNYTQIPASYSKLPVITTLREPNQWISSHVRYSNPEHIAQNVLKHPTPPSTIEEKIDVYIEYGDILRQRHNLKNSNVGYFTFHLIIQLHPKPSAIFEQLNNNTIVPFELFSRIHFLNFPNQIEELLDALNTFGYCDDILHLLKTDIHLNRSKRTLDENEQKSISAYVQEFEPLLIIWHKDFLQMKTKK